MQKDTEQLKDSCDYAIKIAEQFLTLSAGGIAFVVGLVFADSAWGKPPFWAVVTSLTLFGLSIIGGWLFLMHVVGKINKDGNYDVFGGFAQICPVIQIALFLGGVACLAILTLERAAHA